MRGGLEKLLIRPGFSNYLLIWLLLTHAGAAILLLTLPVGLPVIVVIFLVILLNAYREVPARLFGQGNRAIREVEFDGQDTVRLLLGDGSRQPAKLAGDSLVTTWLMVLNFKLEGRLFGLSLVLFKDALDAETARKLRVYLNLIRKERVSWFSKRA